jgi:hypothetical protein
MARLRILLFSRFASTGILSLEDVNSKNNRQLDIKAIQRRFEFRKRLAVLVLFL